MQDEHDTTVQRLLNALKKANALEPVPPFPPLEFA